MNFTIHNFDEINITSIKKSKIEELISSITEIDNTKKNFSSKQFLLNNYQKLTALEKINLNYIEIKNNEEEKQIFNIFKDFISNEKIKFISLETNKFTFLKDDKQTLISINLSAIFCDGTNYINDLPNNLTNLEIEFMPYTWVNNFANKITDNEEDLDEDDRNYNITDINFNELKINNLPASLKKIKFKIDLCKSNLLVNIFLDKIKIPYGLILEFNFINSNYVQKVCINKIIIPNHIKNVIVKYLSETRISLLEDLLDNFKKNNLECEILKDDETKNKLIIDKILSYN